MDNGDYKYIKFFNTGRSAIEYLLRYTNKNNGKILLPAFICSSIVDAVRRAGGEYDFYSITENFQINIRSLKEKLDSNVNFIYVIQYFGGYQTQETYVFLKELQSLKFFIIEDVTLSLYSKHPNFIGFGDYVIGSLRKWLPIPDGAFLSSIHMIPDVPIAHGYNEYSFNYFVAQIMKWVYLRDTTLDKQQYLMINEQAMKALFSDYTIRDMTNISRNYLSSYDMNYVIERRIRNYDYLVEKSKVFSFIKPIFSRLEGQVPFGFVILCKQRDRLLKYLIDNNIYCNVHWKIPEECSDSDSVSSKLSKMILTIPCDQRYGEREMDYVIEILEKFNRNS